MSCNCIGHPLDCYDHPKDCGCTKREAQLAAMPERQQFLPSDYIKFAVASPLAMQVYEIGVCAKCHTKTMSLRHSGGGMNFWQCRICLLVAVLPDSARENT